MCIMPTAKYVTFWRACSMKGEVRQKVAELLKSDLRPKTCHWITENGELLFIKKTEQ